MANILILGGTGHVGSEVTTRLAQNGNFLTLIVQKPDLQFANVPNIQPIELDLRNLELVNNFLQQNKFDFVFYGIGLIREFPHKGITFLDTQFNYAKNIIDCLKKHAPETKFIYISANGVQHAVTPYQQTKLVLEQYLAASGLNFVVLRPSIIVGNSGKYEFVKELKSLIFGPFAVQLDFGNQVFAPVSRRQLADLILLIVQNKIDLNKIYVVGGENTTWRAMQKIIAGKWLMPIPAPSFILGFLGRIFRYQKFFPLTDHQVKMLKLGNGVETYDIWRQANILPDTFKEIWDKEYKQK